MRLYTFINFYLSQIQAGIQSAHILGEIVNDYIITPVHETGKSSRTIMVEDFLQNHKTMIVCNGGNNQMLLERIALFDDVRNPFPFAIFHEDEDSLCGALTGVGIVLPEYVYEAKRGVKIHDDTEYKCFEYDNLRWYEDDYMYELIDAVKSAPLAR